MEDSVVSSQLSPLEILSRSHGKKDRFSPMSPMSQMSQMSQMSPMGMMPPMDMMPPMGMMPPMEQEYMMPNMGQMNPMTSSMRSSMGMMGPMDSMTSPMRQAKPSKEDIGYPIESINTTATNRISDFLSSLENTSKKNSKQHGGTNNKYSKKMNPFSEDYMDTSSVKRITEKADDSISSVSKSSKKSESMERTAKKNKKPKDDSYDVSESYKKSELMERTAKKNKQPKDDSSESSESSDRTDSSVTTITSRMYGGADSYTNTSQLLNKILKNKE